MRHRIRSKRFTSILPWKRGARLVYALTTLGLCAIVFLLTVSATVSTEVAPEMVRFKNATVFLTYLHDDKMELAPQIRENFQKLGFRMVDTKTEAQLIGRFIYSSDSISMYRLRVTLHHAITGEKLAGATSEHSGFIEKPIHMRVDDVFDAIQADLKQLASIGTKDTGYRNEEAMPLSKVHITESVMVSPLTSKTLSHTEKVLLSDYLRKVLTRNGFAKVISGSEMKLYVLEQDDGINTGSECGLACRLTMGRSLSASILVTGQIQREGDRLKLDLTLVDVKSGKTKLSVNETIAYSQRLMPAVERAGWRLVHDYFTLENH